MMLDNASNNTGMVESLQRRAPGLFNTERQGHCAAHIINLIVKDILSTFSGVAADTFDDSLDSDFATFQLPDGPQPVDDIQDELEAEDDDPEIADNDLPDLLDIEDDDDDESDASSVESPSAPAGSPSFVHKVCK